MTDNNKEHIDLSSPPLGGGQGAVHYHDYLQLDKILSAQQPESDKHNASAHDETLFIIIHQTYELWFKQLHHEADSVLAIMRKPAVNDNSPELQTVVHRLHRMGVILRVLVQQIDVLETMTPMDFLDFRDLLRPASGFQSWQFKLLEAKLGLKFEHRHGQEYYTKQLHQQHIDLIKEAEASQSLVQLVSEWLERMPHAPAHPLRPPTSALSPTEEGSATVQPGPPSQPSPNGGKEPSALSLPVNDATSNSITLESKAQAPLSARRGAEGEAAATEANNLTEDTTSPTLPQTSSTQPKEPFKPAPATPSPSFLERGPGGEVFHFWPAYKQAYSTSLAEAEKDNIKYFDEMFFQQRESHYTFSAAANRAALFIMLYRGYPLLQTPFQLLNELLDIDEQLSTWRHRHMNMVHRMIGTRVGTGGSTGKDYLKAAADKHYIFKEIAQLTSFLIERRHLPQLPKAVERQLGFAVG